MHCINNNHLETTIIPKTIQAGDHLVGKSNMGFLFLCFVVFFLTIFSPGLSFSAYLNLPKDASGWTIFSPSVDTDVTYVDSVAGSDTTCRSYRTSDNQMGSDPFHPAGAVLPCATAAKAKTFIGNGQPDWMLCKRGSVFNEGIENSNNGRSATEPIVIASYGTSGDLPIFRSGYSNGGGNRSVQYLAISGIDFYRDTRDPISPNYSPSGQATTGLLLYLHDQYQLEAVLIEGCRFRFFLNNVNISPGSVLTNSGLMFRRNTVLSAYSNNEGHSQGILAYNMDGFTIEENIFDHNGWLVQSNGDATQDNGEATIFNHNAYLTNNKNMLIKNNVFIRGASNNTKIKYQSTGLGTGLVVDNNLYLGGEVAVSVGPTDEHADYSAVNPQVTNNVWLNPGKWNPTNREVAWFFYNHNWDGGEIAHNYMLHQTDDAIVNGSFFHIGFTGRNISVHDNVVYDSKNITTVSLQALDTGDPARSGISITDNVFDTTTSYIVDTTTLPDLNAYSFSGNKYNTTKTANTWFNIHSTVLTNAQWQSTTGDNSTFEQVIYLDPTRSIETYMTHTGGTATADAFIAGCRKQDRFNWDERYTSNSVNAWIKEGFRRPGNLVTPTDFHLN